MYITYAYNQYELNRRGDLDVTVIEKFGVVDCAQHFGEDLARMDGLLFYFRDTFDAIFTFCFKESFCFECDFVV